MAHGPRARPASARGQALVLVLTGTSFYKSLFGGSGMIAAVPDNPIAPQGPGSSARSGMIVSCPTCSTRYRVADESLVPDGRTVRCAKCGNSWTQQLEAEEPAAATPEPEPEPVAVPEPETTPCYAQFHLLQGD